MRILVLVALAFSLSCALGNAEWRRAAGDTTLAWAGAGDEQCSHPAPYPSLRACLIHDAAYELARQRRDSDPDGIYTSEQARLVADLHLAAQMAADGYPEFWVWAYYVGVRLGGWWSWHFAGG